MKCVKCGNEYPSAYYFRVNGVCRECFDKLPDKEKNELLELERYYNPGVYERYPKRVGFGLRFGAIFLDFIAVYICLAIVIGVTGVLNPLIQFITDVGFMNMAQDEELIKEFTYMMENLPASALLLFSLVPFIYRLSEVLLAATPGKFIFGLRIVNSDGTRASYAKLAIRFVIKQADVLLTIIALAGIPYLPTLSQAAFWLVIIGCFWALTEKRQAWHDMFADTAVYKRQDIVEQDQIS